jgi:hypothetical protein
VMLPRKRVAACAYASGAANSIAIANPIVTFASAVLFLVIIPFS